MMTREGLGELAQLVKEMQKLREEERSVLERQEELSVSLVGVRGRLVAVGRALVKCVEEGEG